MTDSASGAPRAGSTKAASTGPAVPVPRHLTLTKEQFDALVLGLPWQRLEQMRRIEHV